tara:strand:+ start:266 stop:487 length:222 start_codon:yes stop_codon:yes gene_type:complete
MHFLKSGISGRIKRKRRKNILIKKAGEEGQERRGSDLHSPSARDIDGLNQNKFMVLAKNSDNGIYVSLSLQVK